jgi:hypothetical protein
MDIYERLREILDSHPSTAPKAKSIDEILRILFTRCWIRPRLRVLFIRATTARRRLT